LDEEKTDANDRKAKKPAVDTKGLRSFLSALEDFNMDGREKILIRIDKRTMSKLRLLKTVSNIDMTRVIFFPSPIFNKPFLAKLIYFSNPK